MRAGAVVQDLRSAEASLGAELVHPRGRIVGQAFGGEIDDLGTYEELCDVELVVTLADDGRRIRLQAADRRHGGAVLAAQIPERKTTLVDLQERMKLGDGRVGEMQIVQRIAPDSHWKAGELTLEPPSAPRQDRQTDAAKHDPRILA